MWCHDSRRLWTSAQLRGFVEGYSFLISITLNWILQVDNLDSHSFQTLFNSLHLTSWNSLTFIPILLLACVNSLSVLTDAANISLLLPVRPSWSLSGWLVTAIYDYFLNLNETSWFTAKLQLFHTLWYWLRADNLSIFYALKHTATANCSLEALIDW